MSLASSCVSGCNTEHWRPAPVVDRSLADHFVFEANPRRWTHQAPAPRALGACVEISKARRACVASEGQLWLDGSDWAELSPQLFPEDLVAVWSHEKDLRVLGQSGTVYSMDASTLSRSRELAPPSRFDRVLRSGETLVGISGQRLLRSDDDGASWQRVSSGPESAVDVAVDGLGRVAVLGIPEQIWQAESLTAPLTPIGRPSDGTTALVVEQGQTKAVSVLHGKTPLLSQLGSPSAETLPLALRHPIAEYLEARDFVDRRVAVFGDGYVVARRVQGGWQLRRGVLGRPLDAPLPTPEIQCERLTLTTLGKSLWAFCSGAAPVDIAQPIAVLWTKALGQRFAQFQPTLMGVPKELRVLGNPDLGAVLITGICPPEPATTTSLAPPPNAAGCHPRGLFRIDHRQDKTAEPAQGFISIDPVSTPALSSPAVALAASPSAKIVAAVAKRTKTDALTLLISSSSGRDFDALPMPMGLGGELRGSSRSGEKRDAARYSVDALTVEDDGSLSLVTMHGDHPRLHTLDRQGQLVSAADAPAGTSLMGAFEDSVLALSRTEGRLYESGDRGANFEPVARFEANPCLDTPDCAIICQRAGCLVGNRLTRLGYGHHTQPRLERPASLIRSRQQGPLFESLPIADCELSHEGLRNLGVDSPHPSIAHAGLGAIALSLLAITRDGSNALVADVTRTQRNVSFEKLFARKTSSPRSALGVERDSSGWVALRIEHLGTANQSIGKAELAWSNLADGRRHFTTSVLEDRVGALSFTAVPDGHLRVAPGWLIPWGDNVLVQISPRGRSGEFSGHLLGSPPLPRPIQFDGWRSYAIQQEEFAELDGRVVPLALTAKRMVLLRGSDNPASNGAVTLAAAPRAERNDSAVPDAPAAFARLGQRLGVLVRLESNSDEPPHARFYPVLGQDAPVSTSTKVPLVVGATGVSTRCDARLRADAERIVIELAPGGQPQFQIHLTEEAPLTMTSSRAVLYVGTREVCWDVLQAEDVARGTSVLLFGDPASNSWIFRSTDDMLGHRTLEAATLECHIGGNSQRPANHP